MTDAAATPAPPREAGVTVVEVVIAAIIIAAVVVASVSVFANAGNTQSSTKARTMQATVADAVVGKLRSDPSWTRACEHAAQRCQLDHWFRARHPHALTVVDAGTAWRFQASIVARGADLPEDGLAKADSDGVVPDFYQLSVTVVPTRELERRFPGIEAYSLQSHTSPGGRAIMGRLGVTACIVTNQIDERLATGTCGMASQSPAAAAASPGPAEAPESTKLLAPPSLVLGSVGVAAITCTGAANDSKGTDGRDCRAFKCADPDLSRMPLNGLTAGGECSVNLGCEGLLCTMRSPWTPDVPNAFYTSMRMRAATGSVRVTAVDGANTGYTETRRLVDGYAEFASLPDGTYKVEVSAGRDAVQLWESHSVPAGGLAAVEAGLKSHVVQLYQPTDARRVDIPVRTYDKSAPPWLATIDGTTKDIKARLVPAPLGRVGDHKIVGGADAGAQTLTFEQVPTGLYAAYVADEEYETFDDVLGAPGFFWVDTTTAGLPVVPGTQVDGNRFEIVYTLDCSDSKREGYGAIGSYLTNPSTGESWQITYCDGSLEKNDDPDREVGGPGDVLKEEPDKPKKPKKPKRPGGSKGGGHA